MQENIAKSITFKEIVLFLKNPIPTFMVFLTAKLQKEGAP